MPDRTYLLFIKELKTELEKDGLDSPLAMQALEKLDAHRKEKVLRMGNSGKRAEAIGAGLLLQLGLQDVVTDTSEDELGIQKLSVHEILTGLSAPVEATYRYGEKGKPYFAEPPLCFSISHSGDYVLAVFSSREIGADIQYEKPGKEDRMVQRFFSPEEKAAWEKCTDPEERRTLFYRLWTRKEAYGKLLGTGMIDVIGMDMESLEVCFEEHELENEYRVAICKYKSEN